MKVPRHAIAKALVERSLQASSPEELSKLGEEIAAYLLSTRRTGEVDSLMRDMTQYRADRGIVEVIVRSAFPLSEHAEADIVSEVQSIYPQATKVIISHRHDATVIAGVKLEFSNQQLDLSVRNKLNRMKQLTLSPSETIRDQELTRKER